MSNKESFDERLSSNGFDLLETVLMDLIRAQDIGSRRITFADNMYHPNWDMYRVEVTVNITRYSRVEGY